MLSKEQKERIQTLAEFEWFDDDDSDKEADRKLAELMSQISTEEELLYASIAKVWDFDGSNIWILFDHPLSDYGLALRWYWMSQPDFYYRKIENQKDFSASETESWKVIKELEDRLLSGHYGETKTAFDPEEVVGREVSDTDKHRPGIRLIPSRLKEPAKGQKIEFHHEQIWS